MPSSPYGIMTQIPAVPDFHWARNIHIKGHLSLKIHSACRWDTTINFQSKMRQDFTVGKNTGLNLNRTWTGPEPRFSSKFSQLLEPDHRSSSRFSKNGKEPDWTGLRQHYFLQYWMIFCYTMGRRQTATTANITHHSNTGPSRLSLASFSSSLMLHLLCLGHLVQCYILYPCLDCL